MSVRRLAEVQPASFEFTPENKAWAAEGDRQISARAGKPPPSSRCSGARRRRAATGCRSLRSRRSPRFSTCRRSACSRWRPFTRCSTSSRSGAATCSSAARRPACCSGAEELKAILRKRIGEPGPCHCGRPVLLGRGRVSRRLLQRADGADQRRLLRGPDAGELRQAARRPRRRTPGQDRLADRPGVVRAGRRSDGADHALRRRRAQRTAERARRAGQ